MKVIDRTVHTFSKDNPSVCNANSGDILLFKTQDCFGGQIQSEAQLVNDLDLSKTNPATGPVYIVDAEKGDVLAVDILDIKVGREGFSCSIPEMGPLSHLAETRTRLIPIKDGIAFFNDVKWPIDPMIGVIGTAPDGDAIPCVLVGNHGGNIDSNLIKRGTQVYLPVRVPGALLQLGDLHAAMGNGELCGTGIEIAGEVLVRVSLIKGFELNWPMTETSDYWHIHSTSANYQESLRLASEELARLTCPAYKWDLTDFFIYLSIQGEIAMNSGVLPVMPALAPMINVRVGIPKIADKNRLITS
jgi:amidase